MCKAEIPNSVSKQSNNGDYKNFVVAIVWCQFCIFMY